MVGPLSREILNDPLCLWPAKVFRLKIYVMHYGAAGYEETA